MPWLVRKCLLLTGVGKKSCDDFIYLVIKGMYCRAFKFKTESFYLILIKRLLERLCITKYIQIKLCYVNSLIEDTNEWRFFNSQNFILISIWIAPRKYAFVFYIICENLIIDIMATIDGKMFLFSTSYKWSLYTIVSTGPF